MNQAQLNLYRFEWGKTRRWLREHGRTPERADSMRHEIHRTVLGRDKSSLDFTNADLDKVLAKFRSYSDGANLDAQLAAEDQPEHRMQAMRANAREIVSAIVDRPGLERAYLDGLARKVFKKTSLDDLSERDLQQLVGIVSKHKRRKVEPEVPF